MTGSWAVACANVSGFITGGARAVSVVALAMLFTATFATPAMARRRAPAHPHAQAQDHRRDQQACGAALRDAKEHEQSGSLLEAKHLLVSCSRDSCAEFVRQQCVSRRAKLEADTPTLVFVVTDPAGAPRNDVQVRIDGTPLPTPLDGRPVEVDPGFHDFSFTTNGHVFAAQKILIVQGQRNRFVTAVVGGSIMHDGDPAEPAPLAEPPEPPVLTLRSPIATTPVRAPRRADAAKPPVADDDKPAPSAAEAAAPAPEEPAPAAARGRVGLLPLVLGGVGVASLGVGALFTVWGRKDNDRLTACAPSCSPDNLSHIRRLYLEADVAYGVGVAALGASYLVYAVRHGASHEAEASQTALRLDVLPTRAGGLASILGAF